MSLKPELLKSIADNDPSLIAVDLSHASVSHEDIQSLECALKTNRTLAWLKLPDNAIVAEHSATLAEAILASGNKNIYSVEPQTLARSESELTNTTQRSLAKKCSFNAGLANYFLNQLSSNKDLGSNAFPDVGDMIPLMVSLVKTTYPHEHAQRIPHLLTAVKNRAAQERVKLSIPAQFSEHRPH